MRAIVAESFGEPEVMHVADVADPRVGPRDVLIRTAAAGVNRADTLQRQGYYPPPAGVSDVIGLECSGTVVAVGADVDEWSAGDEVCALLAGGGYAEFVVAPVEQVMPIPEGWDLVQAAALPEVACTVWSNVYQSARLLAGESLLVHGGAGGIGTFAIQLAAARGHRVLATAGSPDKVRLCEELGAARGIHYRDEDFVEVTLDATNGHGIDVILDNIGGSYLDRNIDALATGGRLAVIAMQGGTRGELRLAKLLAKRASVGATSLRPRPTEEKGAICREVVEHVWPLVASGQVQPVIHATLAAEHASEAHQIVEASAHTGKILLTM